MKFLRTLLSSTIIFLVLCGCSIFSSRHQNADPFYSQYSERELLRFPLIKPYESIYLEETGWMIELHISPYKPGIPTYTGIAFPEKLSVKNNVIMVYTTYVPMQSRVDGEQGLYWFVLLPEEKKELGFKNEPDFLNFIKQYGIDSPDWQNVDDAFRQFRETGCLAWIPDCK